MGLFEVQRLVSAWPSIRNIQTLRDMLVRENEIDKVFLIPGHVVVSCSSSSDSGWSVYLFDQVPLAAAVSSEDSNPFILSSQLINVVTFDNSRIGLVCASGTVHIMKFIKDACHWEEHGSFQLSCNGLIAKAVLSRHGNKMVYLVQHDEGDWSYSLWMDSLNQVNDIYQVCGHTQLLCYCPLFEFFIADEGVWIVPEQTSTTPLNLMMYWGNSDKAIRVHFFHCNKESTVNASGMPSCQFEFAVEGIEDFREICRKTAWKWRQMQCDEYIVSICVHPVSADLLVLMNSGRIYRLRVMNGSVYYKSVVLLKDFTKRYPSTKPWFSFVSLNTKVAAMSLLSLQLFVCHTYYGICVHGELRVYDSGTGEFVWECDDLDHTSTRMINTTFPSDIPLPVALLNKSGIYLLKCKRITDHAEMFVNSLFPVATNADETTPGSYLQDGELYAAHTCDMWGLSLLASHYTITLAYQIFKGEKSGKTMPFMQPELMMQLDKLFSQSPSLCIALMSQYPVCHKFLVDHLSNHLSKLDESSTQTTLESETVPLMKQYFELSQQYEMLMNTPTKSIDSVLPVQRRVKELVDESQQSTVSSDPTVALRGELSFLCTSSPHETLRGIKEFMNVHGSFADSLIKGIYSPDINWRNLFACEIAEKAQQTSMKPSIQSARLPVFETLCNLLYQLEPEDLIQFVEYAHMVRESQHGETTFIRRNLKKEYFYQRALEAIPQPGENSTQDQMRAYSDLCLLSDYSNVELEALNTLLKNKMWESAITVLRKIKKASGETPSHMCSALFHRSLMVFSEGGVLHLYLKQLWELLPEAFSITDFIDILKLLKLKEKEAITSVQQLSIAEVTPYILQLLAQENKLIVQAKN